MFKMTNDVTNHIASGTSTFDPQPIGALWQKEPSGNGDPLVKNTCPMIPLAKGTLGHNGTVWPIEPMVKGTHWSKILRPRGLVKASGKMIHTLYSYV